MSRADILATNDKKVHDLVLRGTPPQFDSSEALATTAHVQRALGSYSGQKNYAGDTVLTKDDIGKFINFPQPSIATLPLASEVPQGAVITIAGSVTVKAQGKDQLAGLGGSPGPFSIPIGSFGVFRRLLVADGWGFDGGDAALKFSPIFAAILGANANQVLPSGWTFKIGHASTDGQTGAVPVTFPVAFPTACMFVVAMYAGASGVANPSLAQCGVPTRTGFTGYLTNVVGNNASVTSGGYAWLAIGY